MRRSKRRPPPPEFRLPESKPAAIEPELWLAITVLLVAVRDWQHIQTVPYWKMRRRAGDNEYGDWQNWRSPRAELEEFFRSNWFVALADGVGLDPEAARERLRIRQ